MPQIDTRDVKSEMPWALHALGYDFYDISGDTRWHAVPSWGLDGWDLGEWPYVAIFVRNYDGHYSVVEYCEGDATETRYDSLDERNTHIDRWALDFWTRKNAEWLTRDPADLQGPFSWDRLNGSKERDDE